MKRRIYPIILFVLLVAFIVYFFHKVPYGNILLAISDNKASINQEKEQNQMPLELTVAEGQVFKQGEPIKLVGKLKNVSDKTLNLLLPVEWWSMSMYLEKKHGAGFVRIQRNMATEPDKVILMTRVPPDRISLKPSEEYTFSADMSPEYYSLPGVGRYRVYMEYWNTPGEDRSAWAGEIKSPITTISIVE